MHTTVLALLEILLLAAGGLAARGFVRRVGTGERKVVVMASVAAWLVLFGIAPFLVFAAFVPAARPGQPAVGPAETLVFNLIPLALVASPVAGVIQALRVTASRQ